MSLNFELESLKIHEIYLMKPIDLPRNVYLCGSFSINQPNLCNACALSLEFVLFCFQAVEKVYPKIIEIMMNEMRNAASLHGGKSFASEAFNYDVILDYIGRLGKFQLMTCLSLLVPALFSAIVVMSYSFTGAIPQFRYHIFLSNY